MSNLSQEKAATRSRLREQLKALTEIERLEASDKIRQTLQGQDFWQEATSILAFVPMRSEPDIWPAVLAAWAAGRQVHLPRFEPALQAYVPCLVRDPGADLTPGLHGIPEPGRECPVTDGKHLDLVLVPGVGFTPSGGRLGRGKGYYDRLLSTTPGCKCGVAFEQQVYPELPLELHDVRLDFLVTPSRCLAMHTPGSR